MRSLLFFKGLLEQLRVLDLTERSIHRNFVLLHLVAGRDQHHIADLVIRRRTDVRLRTADQRSRDLALGITVLASGLDGNALQTLHMRPRVVEMLLQTRGHLL